MRRKWNRWRFHQRSRVVYILVPWRPRIVASGLVATVRLIEIWR